ncbi:MAG: hypothetical protein RI958_2596 [Actinomycetota bacterium]
MAATTLVIAIASVLALRASNDWVDRRRVVLIPASAQVDRLLLALLDQQNGSRGYILSSNPSFLDSYVEGRREERDSSAQLRALMADDAEVIDCLVRLDSMSAVWHDDVVAPQIALVEAGRRDEAIEIVESGVGRESFAAIRAELDELASLLDVRLDDGGTRLDRWVTALGALAIAGVGVAGIATLLVSIALRRGLTVPLERLSREATAVAGGHLDTSITPGGPVEVDAVARSVEHMRRILLSEISASFNKGVVEAEQVERARLAGELHDDPIQALSAAQWRLEASLPTIGEPERRSLEGVVSSLGEVQMRLRDLMFELHPPSLDTDGLAVALEDLLDETFAGTGVSVHLVTDIDDGLPRVLAGLTYRLAAEAIRNARRHAAPRNLTVTAQFDRGVRVTVVDDGEGFDGAPVPLAGHHGTQLGPALAAAAGGWWELSSRSSSAHPDDHGTTVAFWLPLADDI